MVNYKNIAIISGILLITGIILIIVSNFIEIPSAYKTFLGIPYETNPEYSLNLMIKTMSLMIGIFLIVLSPLYALLDIGLEQRKKSSQVPAKEKNKLYCSTCGTKNPVEGIYCLKCGKELIHNKKRD